MTILRPLTALLAVSLLAVLPAAAGKADRARRQIIEADTRFAQAVKDNDLERFRELVSEKALFFGATLHEGRDAVVRAWSVLFEPAARTTLTWKPVRAEVASSGDLGYTVGRYVRTSRDDEGKATEQHGVYVTIWRKEKGGRWRAALDIGTPPGSEPVEIPED